MTVKHIKSYQIILVLFITFNSTSVFSQKKPKKTVVFGEHSERIKYNVEDEFHIHLDQNGDYYPSTKISDDELKSKGQSQLRVWAQEYPESFEKVAKQYNLKSHSYSKQNFDILQDSIVIEISTAINKYSKNKYQTWIIHGFRKNLYHDVYTKGTSYADNIKVKNSINNYLDPSPKKPYYVELYWDGKFRPYSSKFSLLLMPSLFKKAIPNAEKCGYSLRKIFSELHSKKINILTHSTGTHVGVSLLFNVKNKFNYSTPTPSQTINLVLIASASSGKKLFKNYYKRNTTYNFKNNDNYKVVNVYNKKDNILVPNLFYPGRASTKLGCNRRNESGKLLEYFGTNFPNSKYFEVPINYNNGAEHRMINYINDTNFNKVIQIIY